MTQVPLRQVPVSLSRRNWIRGIAGGAFACVLPAFVQEASPGEGEVLEKALRAKGISGVRLKETKRYVGIGNAPEDFLSKAVSLCEALADDYFRHFKAKGFELSDPTAKLHVIALGGPEDFKKFLGYDPGEMVGGLYDLDTNHLVLFDNRDSNPSNIAALRANTVALYHEAMHQLTFNTGLLDRKSEVPLVISEGLAMYGEVRRPDGKTPIGRINVDRVGVIVNHKRDGLEWLSLEQLFDDGSFARDDLVQMAYAQSWLLMHGLLQQKQTIDKLMSYFTSLKRNPRSSTRLELFASHLGEVSKLEQDLQAYARRLASRF